MNNREAARLIGFCNPADVQPSFVIPVFQFDGHFALQDASFGSSILHFVECDVNEAELMQLGEDRRVALDHAGMPEIGRDRRWYGSGDNPVFAFVSADGVVSFGCEQGLKAYLNRYYTRLHPYSHVRQDVLAFLGEQLDDLLRIYLVLGTNQHEESEWCYIRVRPSRVLDFESRLVSEGGSISSYGDIVISGVGIQPSDAVVKWITKTRGRQRCDNKTAEYLSSFPDELWASIGSSFRDEPDEEFGE